MKICLAGTGAMGEIHMKALEKLKDVQVVSINSRTEEGGKAFAEKWKIPFQSTNLEACIDRPGVDAVILTTPSSMHPDQTILALNKGKHVQVEIPMSLNLPDAKRMLEVAKKSGKVCMVTHTRRFSSPIGKFAAGFWKGSFTCSTWSSRPISSGEPISICMAPRDRGSTICCGTMAAIQSIWRTGCRMIQIWRSGDRRALIIPSWA